MLNRCRRVRPHTERAGKEYLPGTEAPARIAGSLSVEWNRRGLSSANAEEYQGLPVGNFAPSRLVSAILRPFVRKVSRCDSRRPVELPDAGTREEHPLTSERVVMHLSLSDITHSSRVQKESHSVLTASAANRVLLLELWQPGLPLLEHRSRQLGVRRIRLWSRPLSRRLPAQLLKYVELLVKVLRIIRAERPMLIHAHSLPSLPIAVVAKWLFGCALVYDAHELEPHRNGLHGLRKRLAGIAERFLIRYADLVLVVSGGIADWYEEQYRLQRPTVVRNLPAAAARSERASPLRERCGLNTDALIFLYLGLLGGGRSIELMCRAFAQADRTRHLVVLGYGELEPLVREYARQHPNIHYLGAVPPSEVDLNARGADVGLCLIEKVCLSYELSLPNKLFQCLFEGVPVLINDLPEQSRFVKEFGCGWITEPGEKALSRLVNSIDRADINARREKARAAANSLSWETDVEPYVEFCRRLKQAP